MRPYNAKAAFAFYGAIFQGATGAAGMKNYDGLNYCFAQIHILERYYDTGYQEIFYEKRFCSSLTIRGVKKIKSSFLASDSF